MHVGANLAAEADFGLGGVELAHGVAALLEFQFVELRAQNLHGDFAVLVLAALVLALHDDAGREVGDAHGGFDFVDVLAAVAAGAKGVDAQIVGLDVDFDAIVNFRDDEDGGERSVAARGLVERRDAHQAVHAAFAGEHAVGVLAFDLHGGGFDARFFAGRGIEDRGAKTFVLGPAQVHAQKHFGPVLRFGAAGAGLYGDDGVEAIVFAGEQSFRFELGDVGIGGGDFLGDVFEE